MFPISPTPKEREWVAPLPTLRSRSMHVSSAALAEAATGYMRKTLASVSCYGLQRR